MTLAQFATLGVLAVATAGLACEDPYGSSGGCTPTASQVCMTGSTFNPTTRTVSAGTTVTWRNGDGVTHTVTNNPGSGETFNQSVGGGGQCTHEFWAQGTYGDY